MKRISIFLPIRQIKELKYASHVTGHKRSEIIRRYIDDGLKELRGLKRP